jgi:hypothetical protein
VCYPTVAGCPQCCGRWCCLSQRATMQQHTCRCAIRLLLGVRIAVAGGAACHRERLCSNTLVTVSTLTTTDRVLFTDEIWMSLIKLIDSAFHIAFWLMGFLILLQNNIGFCWYQVCFIHRVTAFWCIIRLMFASPIFQTLLSCENLLELFDAKLDLRTSVYDFQL